ncbi:hypothetical protein PQR70_38515 [Paraburkholderia madseniana]|uniref:Uncharacterized protein n=1 Tax=Paraburkholderia madseniana TaxID=2599607 RepID=A0AAP5BGP8_9BURK|nr:MULTISPECIES: hypothetical protein [Paraburkholderia]MCX4149196.1 hypothetical protein [Paraburkholderia madseniana]MDN7152133.1 hypothetical protein [Paraburkholderia sp. WS6]MDQ6411013.1 hypothetical protein [Paraburkholderia madseniana]
MLLKKYPISTVAPLPLLVLIFGEHIGTPKAAAASLIVLGLAIGLYGKHIGTVILRRAGLIDAAVQGPRTSRRHLPVKVRTFIDHLVEYFGRKAQGVVAFLDHAASLSSSSQGEITTARIAASH